jgi:hypothetical protein
MSSSAALAALAACAIACGAPSSSVPELGTTDQRPVSWEQFRAHNVAFDAKLNAFVVEDDIVLPDEPAVRAYYEAAAALPDALTVNVTSSGQDDLWSRTDRWNITYCVSTNLGSNQAQMLTSAQKAMAAWEAAADVRFVHLTSEDSNCTTANPNVKLPIVRGPDDMAFTADCGLPSYDKSIRQLRIKWPAGTTFSDQLLTAIAMHELGHGIGFRHEHIRDPNPGGCAEGGSWRGLTPYDGMSVMHYPTCPGWTDTSWTWNFMTQWDIEGAQSVYGAPTNVINLDNGTVFARQRSTGNLYQRSGSGWSIVGGPGQAFVAVGNTLYGQTPGRGSPVVFTPGVGWSYVGGPSGQIFNCGGYLCATDPNSGSIARRVGTSWSFIGGAGARFASSIAGGSGLFGITPNEHSIARYNGSGANWTLIGDDASEIFGGGNGMFRLTTDRNYIQRYDGPYSWTTIGGAGRQFLPTAGSTKNALYALTPDANWVMQYNTTQWNSIGGPAARLYGTAGQLYATDPNDETIWHYNTSGSSPFWESFGHP